MYLIHVERNGVFEEMLHAPDARFLDAEPLPYEVPIDDLAARRPQRRPA